MIHLLFTKLRVYKKTGSVQSIPNLAKEKPKTDFLFVFLSRETSMQFFVRLI